ncbi:hypothetical protein Pst134EA_033005 [Puccinia striiformis f. sp. tritici]|uniref:uncharacterized protein n=1 Tax=Puccinia striiformis f. sp. tritici TaxID=168172 RepID=UPI00200865DF|nr:uncharacterized protein Pst134EA_033005 [Puccinia striiformis f. sp. tritici]KAH9440828.1 hypothetical protein Pst134EA_033005 [Puccinia striiformis f. sp. tritici]
MFARLLIAISLISLSVQGVASDGDSLSSANELSPRQLLGLDLNLHTAIALKSEFSDIHNEIREARSPWSALARQMTWILSLQLSWVFKNLSESWPIAVQGHTTDTEDLRRWFDHDISRISTSVENPPGSSISPGRLLTHFPKLVYQHQRDDLFPQDQPTLLGPL